LRSTYRSVEEQQAFRNKKHLLYRTASDEERRERIQFHGTHCYPIGEGDWGRVRSGILYLTTYPNIAYIAQHSIFALNGLIFFPSHPGSAIYALPCLALPRPDFDVLSLKVLLSRVYPYATPTQYHPRDVGREVEPFPFPFLPKRSTTCHPTSRSVRASLLDGGSGTVHLYRSLMVTSVSLYGCGLGCCGGWNG